MTGDPITIPAAFTNGDVRMVTAREGHRYLVLVSGYSADGLTAYTKELRMQKYLYGEGRIGYVALEAGASEETIKKAVALLPDY